MRALYVNNQWFEVVALHSASDDPFDSTKLIVGTIIRDIAGPDIEWAATYPLLDEDGQLWSGMCLGDSNGIRGSYWVRDWSIVRV